MEEDLSPLEYARSNQLSINYLTERSAFLELGMLQHNHAKQVLNTIDDSHLPTFNFGSELLVEDRLSMTKEAASLIGSIMLPENSEQIISNALSSLEDTSAVKRFKLEPPLLQSDHKIDCMKFARREDFEMKIQDVKLPFEVLDEEKNQGLTWSSELWNASPALIEKLKLERLFVSKDAVSYLQALRTEKWTLEDAESMWDSQQTYQRSCGRDPVTPPLSPMPKGFSCQPYNPSSSDSVYQIPLFSDPLSPTNQELQELESVIFRNDIPTSNCDYLLESRDFHEENSLNLNYVRMSDIYTSLIPPDDSFYFSSLEGPRVKRENLKIDETLTPIDSISLHDKSKDLDIILEVPDQDILGFEESPELDNKLLEEAFLPAFNTAIQKVEQENLIEADITCRVNIPKMDFSMPEPAWKMFENSTKDSLKILSLQHAFIKECIECKNSLWVGLNMVDCRLRWNPFSIDLNTIVFEEKEFPVDNSTWEKFIPTTDETGIIDSSSSVWKPEILRKASEDTSSEEEIDFCLFQDGTYSDLSQFLKKRKLQVEKETQELKKKTTDCQVHYKASDASQPFHQKFGNKTDTDNLGLLLGGNFSACNAVNNYLEIRGNKKPKLIKSSYFNTPELQVPIVHCMKLSNSICQTTSSLIQKSMYLKRATLPTKFLRHEQQISAVVSSSIFVKRLLVKTFEKFIPNLNLVERDFSGYNGISWERTSVARSQNISPLANEADIIISPTTGVVLTTIQKIKQKPLPGQKSQPAIRTLLKSISPRYENILVLVSENRGDECTSGIDARDCLAISELYGFTISLDAQIIIYFIGGGEETLGQWLASFTLRYCTEGPAIVQEETHWELFLRRAGLNAFAAQTVIADLKLQHCLDIDGSDNEDSSCLMVFVRMDSEQRVKRFGRLVGHKVMERVNKLINSSWDI